MPDDTSVQQSLPREVGDGLVLRRATYDDRERVAEFHANTLLDVHEQAPLMRLYGFVLDLMSNKHPVFRSGDFTVVEDTATGKIVSSMCLISQTWSYEGIPFKFGQPDIVSTDPDYRRRGLVSAQIREIHRWSAERGELVQGITGIPWYYRQFGYEMAIDLDGGRSGAKSNVPKLEEGEQEPYTFRPATEEDIPFIMEMYRRTTSRYPLASVRDEALWRFDLEGRNEHNGLGSIIRVIEGQDGKAAGLLIHPRKLWGTAIGTRLFEVVPGVPFLAVTPSVMRYLAATGEEYAKRDAREFENIEFSLGEEHPVFSTISDRLPIVHKPYAWYMRVPDVAAFMSKIAPALEKRLATSEQAGYTGTLKLSFYRSGVQLNFADGRLSVEVWTPGRVEDGDAAFPDLTFLQLLFGYRSIDELQQTYRDCSTANDEARALLPILFPKKHSDVWIGG